MSGVGIPPLDGATRVLIADDHTFENLGLAQFIAAQGPRWQICGTAADGDEAVAKAIELRPDIVIMDNALPRLDVVQAVTRIRQGARRTEVLVLCDTHSRHLLVRIYRCSARGCLLKTESPEELLPALGSLRRHHFFRSRGFTELYEEIMATAHDIKPLTPRENEMLHFIAKGKTDRQIAEEIGRTVKTVGRHRENLKKKFGVHSSIAVVVQAVLSGFLDL